MDYQKFVNDVFSEYDGHFCEPLCEKCKQHLKVLTFFENTLGIAVVYRGDARSVNEKERPHQVT
jgi:hypothetical protein